MRRLCWFILNSDDRSNIIGREEHLYRSYLISGEGDRWRRRTRCLNNERGRRRCILNVRVKN